MNAIPNQEVIKHLRFCNRILIASLLCTWAAMIVGCGSEGKEKPPAYETCFALCMAFNDDNESKCESILNPDKNWTSCNTENFEFNVQ